MPKKVKFDYLARSSDGDKKYIPRDGFHFAYEKPYHVGNPHEKRQTPKSSHYPKGALRTSDNKTKQQLRHLIKQLIRKSLSKRYI